MTTAAKPEIAPYPFTTLQPNLGVVALGVNDTFVIADLPGLIEGASLGKGLGHEFLRHIERTRVLIHLIDGSSLDPLEDFESINEELAAFGHGLSDKPQVVVINKLDMPAVKELFPETKAQFEARGYHDVMGISAIAHTNTRALIGRVYQMVQEAPMPELERPTPVIIRPKLELDDEAFTIERVEEGIWRVRGGKIERAAYRTQVKFTDALLRLHRYLQSQGVIDALREAGVQEDDTVRIGDYEFEWRDRD